MHDPDSDDYAMLQDILDEVLAGRPDGHACPFCGGGPLKVPRLDEGRVRLECPSCRRYFDGNFR